MGFQQGLSGLNAASKNLDVISNNVANANTVGFKASQAQFADVYASSLGGSGAGQIGIGTMVAAVAQQFTQGNITSSNNSLDMAISGGGFFRLDNNGAISYSRNGQFQIDKDGYIVTSQSYRLTGFLPNAQGQVVATSPQALQISTADLLPNATTTVTAGLNLNANSTIISSAFDPADSTTFNNSTSLTVYDTLGNSHIASLYFAKTAANTWETYLTVDGNQVPAAGTALSSLTFGTNGTILTPSAPVTSASFNPTPPAITLAGSSLNVAGTTATVSTTAGLAVGATVTGGGFPAGTTITSIVDATHFTTSAAGTSGATGVTLTVTNPASAAPQTLSFDFSATSQFGSTFGVNAMSQDGYTSGHLTSFSTSSDGMILGQYSNGQSQTLGQVALANFSNAQGLQPLGGNNWAETSASGTPLVGAPGSASLGLLRSSAVEDSNVDLTQELVNMITAQRVYQANAQTVKTQDSVLQTLVNMR
ncbi:MAG: flagellar hook protein FlgE [Gammaproteobacteria bacterium]|nr:flagellar hook protein FlgE [Gammaproteobacteria bacterium]MBU1776218.1 flagellar hook protein FlgE [Gammaproteobacteria bacterium]MBU1968213.1 flagellar hook protein FlgE [Gammaproteobacteria bacterium]